MEFKRWTRATWLSTLHSWASSPPTLARPGDGLRSASPITPAPPPYLATSVFCYGDKTPISSLLIFIPGGLCLKAESDYAGSFGFSPCRPGSLSLHLPAANLSNPNTLAFMAMSILVSGLSSSPHTPHPIPAKLYLALRRNEYFVKDNKGINRRASHNSGHANWPQNSHFPSTLGPRPPAPSLF